MKTFLKIFFGFAVVCTVTQAHAMRWYSPSTGSWFSRDPIGDEAVVRRIAVGLNREELRALRAESLKPAYGFVRNDPISYCDKLGLWPSGSLQVRHSCSFCSDLLKNFRYIPEDDRDNFKLFPLLHGAQEADALYTPVGIAYKINNLGEIWIGCDCKCKCVTIQILSGVTTWNQGRPKPDRWPGSTEPYWVKPYGFDCLNIPAYHDTKRK